MNDRTMLRGLGLGLSVLAIASVAAAAISYNYWIVAKRMVNPGQMGDLHLSAVGIVVGLGVAVLLSLGARRFFRLANELKGPDVFLGERVQPD